jgi:hypothetical protein
MKGQRSLPMAKRGTHASMLCKGQSGWEGRLESRGDNGLTHFGKSNYCAPVDSCLKVPRVSASWQSKPTGEGGKVYS